jgi:hypothetical protein
VIITDGHDHQHHSNAAPVAGRPGRQPKVRRSVQIVSQAFSGQFDAFRLPTVDLTQPVIGYFECLQRVVDVNRDVAIRWAELVTDFAGSMREQPSSRRGRPTRV